MRVLNLMRRAGIARTPRDMLTSEVVAVGDLNGVAQRKGHFAISCISRLLLACYLLKLRVLRRSADG